MPGARGRSRLVMFVRVAAGEKATSEARRSRTALRGVRTRSSRCGGPGSRTLPSCARCPIDCAPDPVVGASLTEDQVGEDMSGVGLHAGEDVLVDAHGEGDVGVAEAFADLKGAESRSPATTRASDTWRPTADASEVGRRAHRDHRVRLTVFGSGRWLAGRRGERAVRPPRTRGASHRDDPDDARREQLRGGGRLRRSAGRPSPSPRWGRARL